MKAIIKSILVLSFLIFSTSSFSEEVRCNCTCDITFHEDEAYSFPAKGETLEEEEQYCEDNNEKECTLEEDGEVYKGELKDCKRSVVKKVIKKTEDTLNQLGIEMK